MFFLFLRKKSRIFFCFLQKMKIQRIWQPYQSPAWRPNRSPTWWKLGTQIEAFLPLLEPILVSHSIHIVQIKEQETIFRKHFFLIFSHSIYLAKIFLSSSRVVVVLVVVVSLSHGAHMWNYVQTFMEYRVIFSFWFLAVGVFFFWADKTDMLFIDWWCIFLPYRYYIKWAKASTESNFKVNGTVPIILYPRWQG